MIQGQNVTDVSSDELMAPILGKRTRLGHREASVNTVNLAEYVRGVYE